MSNLDITVTLEIHTCQCGTVYAIPSWVRIYRCPVCAGHEADDASRRISQLLTQISHMKGALTRLRRRGR